MITKMKKLTFLIYHKDYECFLQSVRDLGVVHVAEKAQGTAENAELQESIRLSDRYASTIKFLQGFNAELQEQEGDVARGEKGWRKWRHYNWRKPSCSISCRFATKSVPR